MRDLELEIGELVLEADFPVSEAVLTRAIEHHLEILIQADGPTARAGLTPQARPRTLEALAEQAAQAIYAQLRANPLSASVAQLEARR